MTDGKEVIQRVRAIEGLDVRYADDDVVLICGDNREVVPRLAEAGVLVHSVVSDPPYNLTQVSRGGSARQEGTGPFGRVKLGTKGFMGHQWDAAEHVFHPEFWYDVLRCCLPGAFLFSFGGTRTSHRLACAIEDAGWEIRDEIENVVSGDQKWGRFWASLTSEQQGAYLEAVAPSQRLSMCFGSGFPKGLAIDKAIDRALGAEREVVGTYKTPDGRDYTLETNGKNPRFDNLMGAGTYAEPRQITAPATDAAKLWQGWNASLKPSYEPVIVAMAPMPGNFAENALKYEVAGLWVDGARIGLDVMPRQIGGMERYNQRNFEHGYRPNAYQKENGRDGEPSADRRYHDQGSTDPAALPGPRGGDPTGRWPPNTSMEHHQGCVCVGASRIKGHTGYPNGPGGKSIHYASEAIGAEVRPNAWQGHADADGLESVNRWSCAVACECGHVFPDSSETVPGCCPRCQSHKTDWICPVKMLDLQAGHRVAGGFPERRFADKLRNSFGTFTTDSCPNGGLGRNSGVASRFFYTSKASSSERDCGLRGKIPCHNCGGLESVHHLMRREDRKVVGAQDCGRDGVPTVQEVAADLKRLRGKAELRDYPWLLVRCHRNYHPTLKSISVMRWIVRLSKTPTGGVVLDPFAGSATTGVACMLEGRQCILIEQDSGYCEIGAARLRACREGAFEKSQKKSVKKSNPAPMAVGSRANGKSSQGHRTLFPME